MDNMYNKYSVLMSVYYKEKAEFLEQSMNSIWNQTIPTDDFVLVCDGPLAKELDDVIDSMKKNHPDTLNIVRLNENSGLGNALNIGIKHCKNELVARMDSDDISRSDRCEKQLAVFLNNQNISVCSGVIEEFREITEKVDKCRIPPETSEEIERFSKKRNPFNHPCVMYKKSAVEGAGGYRDFYLLEDYYLWIRMIQNGCKGYNIQEPLLWMRAGSGLYRRRAGWKYAKSQVALFDYMKNTGFIGTGRYIKSVTIRLISALIPNGMREMYYSLFLRKQ